MPFLMVGGLIAFVGGLIWLAWWFEKKRTEAMEGYASSHGFQFEGAQPNVIGELGRFKLFSQGHSKSLKNHMRGSKELGVVRIADYQYRTGSGKHTQTWNQTICVVQTPGKQAPHFFVRRQRALFDALGKMFGGQDINFDDDPTFSKAYVLQTSDNEQQLRHFMSPRVREMLTQLSNKNVVCEVQGDTMVFHIGKRLKVEEIDALVADAVNLRRTWS